jgi:hypothetical protein
MRNNIFVALLGVAAISIFAVGISGCADQSDVSQTENQTVEKDSSPSGCTAEQKKTVAGLQYEIIGRESHDIQGKSTELCCWYQVNSQGEKIKKICGDRDESPLGYATGILWELKAGEDDGVKTMETYVQDGKSCQQHYNNDGSIGPLSCK